MDVLVDVTNTNRTQLNELKLVHHRHHTTIRYDIIPTNRSLNSPINAVYIINRLLFEQMPL